MIARIVWFWEIRAFVMALMLIEAIIICFGARWVMQKKINKNIIIYLMILNVICIVFLMVKTWSEVPKDHLFGRAIISLLAMYVIFALDFLILGSCVDIAETNDSDIKNGSSEEKSFAEENVEESERVAVHEGEISIGLINITDAKNTEASKKDNG